MAQIVTALAATHAPGLTAVYDGAPEDSKAEVDKMYGTMEAEIAASQLDVLIVIANDHMANSRVLEYPDFLVGMHRATTVPTSGSSRGSTVGTTASRAVPMWQKPSFGAWPAAASSSSVDGRS